MASKANIELYDLWYGRGGRAWWKKGAEISCHTRDKNVANTGIEMLCVLSWATIKWTDLEWAGDWTSATVAPAMAKLWHKDPVRFLAGRFPDGEYDHLWKIFLGRKPGSYRIRCFRVVYDEGKKRVKKLVKVNWTKKAGM